MRSARQDIPPVSRGVRSTFATGKSVKSRYRKVSGEDFKSERIGWEVESNASNDWMGIRGMIRLKIKLFDSTEMRQGVAVEVIEL